MGGGSGNFFCNLGNGLGKEGLRWRKNDSSNSFCHTCTLNCPHSLRPKHLGISYLPFRGIHTGSVSGSGKVVTT